MALQVSELGEAFPAPVEAADVFLGGAAGIVDGGVGAHVAALGEGFAAGWAGEGAFAGVAAEVGFEVAELGEGVGAVGEGARLGSVSCGSSSAGVWWVWVVWVKVERERRNIHMA